MATEYCITRVNPTTGEREWLSPSFVRPDAPLAYVWSGRDRAGRWPDHRAAAALAADYTGVRVAVFGREEEELVDPADACPGCGEAAMDNLEWMNDEDDQVRCATCSFTYSPSSASPRR